MLIVHCKGLCEPNPDGTMAWAFVAVDDATGEVVERQLGSVAPPTVQGEKRATNYVSEYGAILKALDWLHRQGGPPAQVCASLTSALRRIEDPEVWVHQVTTVTERTLAKVRARAVGLPVVWAHVKTESNRATPYAQAAYQEATGRPPTDWAAVNARREQRQGRAGGPRPVGGAGWGR